MRKKLLSITLIFLLLSATVLGVVACNGEKVPTSLETPEITVSSSGVVSWIVVTGAKEYEVRVNSVNYTCTTTYFKLLEMDNLPSDNHYTIRVRAVNGKVYSEWSEMVSYTHVPKAMDAPVLKVENGKLTWTANAKATKIIVKVNGVATELPGSATEFDLSALTENCVITVQFIGDGMTAADSAVATITYNAATGVVALGAPQNVRMEGYELVFDAVPGADVYYLLDVANNVTTVATNRSDRTNKNLVKAVWAGDTSGQLANSESVEVPYFAQGSGTQNDPFLISSQFELRYVEFYESLNEAKYYKFKNDVVLDEYEPGDEEVYNNFYNLGSLSGVIDGDGHKLVNSVVYFSDGYSSLFDSIAPGGVIKNLVIDNANFRTWTKGTNDGFLEKGGECAILAYTNRGTLDNITVINSNVHAERDGAAALVSINKGTIKNSTVDSSTNVYGANEAGGFAIFNSGTIIGCINRGQVSGKTTIGGIVGRNNGLVSQCGNEGTITATTYGGGIVGYNYNVNDGGLMFESLISQCYNYGKVNVVSYGGGIAGKNGGDGINEVGKESYANAGIFSCYNTGAINGANSLGGIVGDNYGYHEVSTDLGVVNCYNSGTISVDTSALKSTRVYLSFENCSWNPEMDNAVFYMHYWGSAGESNWPGVRMTKVTISGRTYYYADMSITAEQLTGVIFNRCNPDTGTIWSQSQDITKKVTSGNLLYKIDNKWEQATTASSAALIGSTPISAGGIAGFNNMINDCYFLAAKVNNATLQAGVAQGVQFNKILLNGKTVQSSACEIAAAQLSTFATTLNTYANVWVDSANGPVLKWQRR